MGGVKSKMADTDWPSADGGMARSDVTVDGQAPTAEYCRYALIKKSKLHDRDFHVQPMLADAENGSVESAKLKDDVLYTVTKLGALRSAFDVLGPDGEKRLRVVESATSFNWAIYSFKTRAFEGQLPDMKVSGMGGKNDVVDKKDFAYLRFKVKFSRSGNTGSIKPIVKSDEDPTGKTDDEANLPILELYEVRGIKTRFQTALPVANGAGSESRSLVAYWDWQNSSKTHAMVLHLAKNADLALHCTLAVLSNIAQTQRDMLYSS